MKIVEYMTENSVYEVQFDACLIRRTQSNHEPTPRQGEDNEWKSFEELSETPGGCLLIRWPGINPNGTLPATLTSPIISVVEVDDEPATDQTGPHLRG